MSTVRESHKKLTITIDGVQHVTRDDDQEVGALLRLAGVDLDRYILAKVKKNGERKLYYRDQRVLDLGDGDTFVTLLFGVVVNETFVELTDRRQSGATLKAAAIAAGVDIQGDFVLSELHPDGHEDVIPDDKEIKVKYNDEFWAIPGDDNS